MPSATLQLPCFDWSWGTRCCSWRWTDCNF